MSSECKRTGGGRARSFSYSEDRPGREGWRGCLDFDEVKRIWGEEMCDMKEWWGMKRCVT